MAGKDSEKYEVQGTASVGETINLVVNSTTVYSESVPTGQREAPSYISRLCFKKVKRR